MEKFFGSMAKVNNKASLNLKNIIDFKNYFEDYIDFDKEVLSSQDFYIESFIDQLQDFNVDFQFSFFKSNCGFLQFFSHKWNKAAMASSVEIRSPFLDKNVYLFLLSLPLDQKIKGGDIKSILKRAYKDVLPDYIVNQNFKQGLPVDKKRFDTSEVHQIIRECLTESDFKNMSWDIKKIAKDFNKNTNINKIWNITKYYLLIKGFKRRIKSVNINKVNLTTVPQLKQ